VKTEGGTLEAEDVPDLEEHIHRGDDASVIHVPLLVNGAEAGDLLDKRGEPEAEVEGTKGVTLLDAGGGVDDVGVVVEEDRRAGIAPVGPVGKGGEGGAGDSHEGLTIDQVEGVLEVDLQEGKVRLRVPEQGVAQRVGNHLDTTGAPDTVVLALENGGDLILARKAKTLGDQAAEGVPAAQGTDARVGLGEGDGDPPGKERLEEEGGGAIGKKVDDGDERPGEVPGLRPQALLEEEGGVAEEARGGAGAEGRQGCLDRIRGKPGSPTRGNQGGDRTGGVKVLEGLKGGRTLGGHVGGAQYPEGLLDITQPKGGNGGPFDGRRPADLGNRFCQNLSRTPTGTTQNLLPKLF